MSRETLMFSMAFNGYDLLYNKCIRTQRAYAKRQGYCYRFVNRPRWTSLTRECAWLKISLMVAALKHGHPWVLFIDADAEVKPATPPIQTLDEPGKSVFLVPGWSGRVNSGVLIVKNTPESLALFERILANAEKPVPAEDSISWGENGHVIHFAKDQPFVKLCSRQWNNNSEPAMEDYIRHYSNGPMRDTYKQTPVWRVLFWVEKSLSRAQGRMIRKTREKLGMQRTFSDNLLSLEHRCRQRYPEFQVQ
jgi:hypothetical protein